MTAAIYAGVSTLDQTPENQIRELTAYVAARGWSATEYVDREYREGGSRVLLSMRSYVMRVAASSMCSSCGAWTGSGAICAT
jgi:DNA invertase Pin-like site-specific DNA recombinase